MIEATHRRHNFALNQVLTTIQEALFRGRRETAYREAMRELARTVVDLGSELDIVKSRAARTLEQLRPS